MALIDKEAIKKFIADGLNSGEFGHDAVQILAEIEYMPTVDAEPVKHGRWKKMGEADYKCSVCGFRFTTADHIEMFPYCRCGAKMDEVK